jgi:hypothetical protein
MPTYSLINNGDSGLSVRTNLNEIIGDINSGVIGATGPAGTSGTSGAAGTSGTSGVSGSSSPTQSYDSVSRNATWAGLLVSENTFNAYYTGGGVMTGYPSSSIAVGANRRYANTLVLKEGETLQTIRYSTSNNTGSSVIQLSLYALSKLDSNLGNGTASGFRVGQKVFEIGTYSQSSNGDKVISNINYTAQSENTYYDTYVLVYTPDGTGHSIAVHSNSQLVPDVGGGYISGGLYYRSFIQYVGTGSNDADLSSVVPTTSTDAGWFFTYRKKIN